ncbi:MAG TPA: hypothetical protein VEW65_09810, partial [Chryseolinea sp.]|nr:hypothetical protein [Chryseolinea sp.]
NACLIISLTSVFSLKKWPPFNLKLNLHNIVPFFNGTVVERDTNPQSFYFFCRHEMVATKNHQ